MALYQPPVLLSIKELRVRRQTAVGSIHWSPSATSDPRSFRPCRRSSRGPDGKRRAARCREDRGVRRADRRPERSPRVRSSKASAQRCTRQVRPDTRRSLSLQPAHEMAVALRRLKTLAAILAECPHDNAFEFDRDLTPARGQSGWRFASDPVANRIRIRPPERHSPGEHLVEHGAGRPDVTSSVDLFAARLFRRHVGRRADHRSLDRELRGISECGETEVRES